MRIDITRETENKLNREIYIFDILIDFYNISVLLDHVDVQQRENTHKKYKTIGDYDRLAGKRYGDMEIEDLKSLVSEEKGDSILKELKNILNEKIETDINNCLFFQ